MRPRGWAGRLWSPAIHAEHRATREAGGLFDRPRFRRSRWAGGCGRLLERLCDNQVARDVGQITYTQMLNPRGGIECDFTVTRLADDRFRIVTGTAFGRHDLAWIREHAPEDGSVEVEDVTARYACIGLWGPAAREILWARRPTATSLRLHALGRDRGRGRAVPCAARHLRRRARLGALRADRGPRALGRALPRPAGRTGCSPAGYKAIDSLRLEKGYRVWGSDITPEDTPYEAGLGFAVKLDKGDFVGRDALLAAQEPERRLACLTLAEPRAVALGSEPVRIDGELVGRVTSGGYGYTVERSIAYAYVPAAHAEPGRPVEVEIFGEWVAGEVAPEPLFDPAGERLRG